MTLETRKKIWGLQPNVFFLGLVSLLTDVSSEMIFTLIPLFLSNVLGASTIVVGLISGLSDSTDAIFRILSGWFSDRIGKRKALSVLGYGLSTLVKPLMYIATTAAAVAAIRFGDRVGKGIRTSPRDALIAGSVTPEERGKSFGAHRAMDTFGAFLGLALVAFIIYRLQGGNLELSFSTYRWLVLIGVVPAVLAVVVHIFFTRDVKVKTGAPGQTRSFRKLVSGLDTRFKIYVAVTALFTLGNSGEFFVILRAQNLGASVLLVTMMLVLLNALQVACSIPAGVLSDKMGRRRIIALGWLVYSLVFLGFALASSQWQVWLLFAGFGVYLGIVEGVGRAFVADLVTEEHKRGTAYGIYHGAISLALLPAGVIAGWLWEVFNPAAAFYFGAALAFMAMLGMLILVRE